MLPVIITAARTDKAQPAVVHFHGYMGVYMGVRIYGCRQVAASISYTLPRDPGLLYPFRHPTSAAEDGSLYRYVPLRIDQTGSPGAIPSSPLLGIPVIPLTMASDVSSSENPNPPVKSHPAVLPNHDLHNHTIYSGHANDDATVANIIDRANEAGLDYLGISEHLMQLDDLPYLRRVRDDINKLVPPGSQILFGVEMDADPADPQGLRILPDLECDYVILSAHSFPSFDLGLTESEKSLPPDLQRRHLAGKWLDWYGNAIAQPGIHILGHPLREPMTSGLILLNDIEFFETILPLFDRAIANGVAFELNNAFVSALVPTARFEGYAHLVRTLKARGMKFARGSDSHTAANVGACHGIALIAEAADLHKDDWLDASTLGRR